ncbi:RsmB/NOP family class I SAM-dependent RNA methyltransferase [Thiobacter sp. AK1]|uniref:RsmB/NOP family class I SAM-dependent RNA methyltransferase n=1 Tax=Thiobacter aerophilum TaxID=3121275 RepID=A0ABV0EER8_9BURK
MTLRRASSRRGAPHAREVASDEAKRPTPGQLAHVAMLLAEVLAFTQPADVLLSRYFRTHPGLGARDRHVIAETVFGILRHLRFLEYMSGSRAPRPLLLAYFHRIQGMSLRGLAPLLNAGEAEQVAAMRAGSSEQAPLAVRADLPDWVVERLRTVLDEATILALGRAMQQPAPLDLRVNTLKASREDVRARLAAQGLAVTPTPFSPVGLRLVGKPAIQHHPLFTAGVIEVQDEGSQLTGFLLAPTRHERVADFCAGAGGKTLLLGALMHSQGRLYAFDVSAARLAKLRPRLARSGLSNVYPQLITDERDARLKRLTGKFDRVLVDAPCSGLGTLRRNPDLKWRQTPDSVAELTAKQARILAAASRLLKPAGRLVYATCSILPEENESIVENFLAQHPEFQLIPANQVLARQHIALDTGAYLELSPALHATDGFFAAVLERTP